MTPIFEDIFDGVTTTDVIDVPERHIEMMRIVYRKKCFPNGYRLQLVNGTKQRLLAIRLGRYIRCHVAKYSDLVGLDGLSLFKWAHDVPNVEYIRVRLQR